ncbi:MULTISPECIES: hypothetical protein [unclassified Microcoleus]|uniref:hypothetical protein n=1 Tax=unclassified Microcoleus TaxID=2642155 RepID=UPI001E0A05E8|nr:MULTISPECIES: hypothetical protein [unclassified Microcoleus]MCC3528522.1 hypothetical protein [Microcoleus sp. PH2017_21_RUC_O_A]
MTADNLAPEATGAIAIAPRKLRLFDGAAWQTNKCTSQYNIAGQIAQGKKEVRQRIV